MATVKVTHKRIQTSSFGLYRTSAGGDESIIVRRKVGEPTDVKHSQSRKLKRQREYLTLASQHYSHLTPSQKAITRHQIEMVQYETGHSKTEEKLLLGRQLFISKEMHSLRTTGKQLVLPHEVCIILSDEFLMPLEGELFLRYLKDAEWKDCTKEELYTGSWLFSQTPRKQEAYRPYGEAENYHDPELPELQFMTEKELLTYHYHILYSSLAQMCHSLPLDLTGADAGACVKHSQPFRPCYEFTLKEILFSLRHHQLSNRYTPASGFIALHRATEGQKPIDPALYTATFDISVPDYPDWRTHKATFPPTLLEADTLYTWVIGFSGIPDPYCRVHIQAGENGTCNLDPIGATYVAYYLEGHWQDWQLFALPQFYYEMRA